MPSRICAGYHHTFILLDGKLWAAGCNDRGQLGIGKSGNQNLFVKVELGGKKVTSVAAGSAHSLAIMEDGELWAAGYNIKGQLGIGKSGDQNLFVKVELGGKKVTSVAAGSAHSLAIMEDGELWAAGYNYTGQLGIGKSGDQNLFVKVELGGKKVTSVAARSAHSLAIMEDGELWAAGCNNQGQLGIGKSGDQNLFVKVELGGKKVTSVAAGNAHSLAIMEDGELWVAGCNYTGQLGIGKSGRQNLFVQVELGGKKVTSVAAGIDHSLAIMEDGELWAAGYNNQGQLGIGKSGNQNLFVKVELGGKKVTSVAAGCAHNLTIMEDGELWSAGSSTDAQLGIGKSGDQDLLVKVDLAGKKLTSVAAVEPSIGIMEDERVAVSHIALNPDDSRLRVEELACQAESTAKWVVLDSCDVEVGKHDDEKVEASSSKNSPVVSVPSRNVPACDAEHWYANPSMHKVGGASKPSRRVNESHLFPEHAVESNSRAPDFALQDPGVGSIDATGHITLKVWHSNMYYRILMSTPDLLTHSSVQKAIAEAVGVQMNEVIATYLDDENDICLLNQRTFSDFVRMALAKCGNVWRLSLRACQVAEQSKGDAVELDYADPEDSDASSIEGEWPCEQDVGCFLKTGTLLADERFDFKPPSSLQVGDFVKSCTGELLEVTFKKDHPKRLRRLTTIRTSVAELTVTSDHRIVLSVNGLLCERPSAQVDVGDFILCGMVPRRVTKVRKFEQRVELVELRLSPDNPIETFTVANVGVQTKGALDPLLVQLPLSTHSVMVKNTFLNIGQEHMKSNCDRFRRARSAE